MNRCLPVAACALLPLAFPLARGARPAPLSPDRPIASLVPERCGLYLEATGLAPLLERGLEHPFLRTLLEGELGRSLLAKLDRSPADFLAEADRRFGSPVLPALAALGWRGIALGVDPRSWKAVLVFHGRDAALVCELLERTLDRIAESYGWPGALDEPRKHGHGGDIWLIGDELVVARREALLVLGNEESLVQDALALAADPSGEGLLGRRAFEALHARKTGRESLWGWADLEELEAFGDQGFRDLRASPRSPAFQSLLGAGLATLASSRALSAWIALEGGDGISLGFLGTEASPALPLVPGSRKAASVPPELPAQDDLAQALLYRDYAAMFAHRSELFPAESLPAFAEQITNAALFLGGKDLGREVLPGVSPWLRVVSRPPRFAAGLEPEIPLPGLVVIASLDEPDQLGPELVAAFQTLVALVNVDQAQKGKPGLRLALEREGESEISSARFRAPGPAEGVDVRYNLEPACSVVGRSLVLGTHESLVREVVRELRAAPASAPSPVESVSIAGAALARVVAQNFQALVAQKRVEEGLSQAAAEEEIEGLRLLLASFARAGAEIHCEDPSSPELRLWLELAHPASEATR